MEVLKYNEAEQKLYVSFTNNLVWEYLRVNKEKYEEIMDALTNKKPVMNLLNHSRYVGILKEVNI